MKIILLVKKQVDLNKNKSTLDLLRTVKKNMRPNLGDLVKAQTEINVANLPNAAGDKQG